MLVLPLSLIVWQQTSLPQGWIGYLDEVWLTLYIPEQQVVCPVSHWQWTWEDDSFHSPTVILPSALDKPSIMKHYHRRWSCSHTSPCRSLATVTLHDTRFVECRCWNDGWTVKTVVTWWSSVSMIPAPGHQRTNTAPTSPSTDPLLPGAQQGTSF